MIASRGKMLLTLALNQQLKEKIKDYSSNQPLQKKQKFDEDEDYIPESNNNSDNSSTDGSANEHSVEDHDKETRKPKINILDNVLITPPNATAVNVPPSLSHEHEPLPLEDDINNTLTLVDFVQDIISDILDNVMQELNMMMFTKKGTLRQRRKHIFKVKERKSMNVLATKSNHQLKSVCNDKCPKKCKEKITFSTRLIINKEFWLMGKKEQKNFILNSTTHTIPKRRTVDHDSRRKKTVTYYFKDKKGFKQEVCKRFFLGTLGYKGNNDKTIRNVLSSVDRSSISANKPDRRASNKRKPIVDRDIIKKHIESFQPQVSHYRREHAPRRRYLPSDVTIQFMYNHFKEKFPNIKFSYNLYWQVLSELNISFTKLGHEECWACEVFLQHSKSTGHKRDSLVDGCKKCDEWKKHFRKYTEARREYQKDATNQSSTKITVTADLQKVGKYIKLC